MVVRDQVLEASARHPQPGQVFQYGTAGASVTYIMWLGSQLIDYTVSDESVSVLSASCPSIGVMFSVKISVNAFHPQQVSPGFRRFPCWTAGGLAV